MPGMGAEDSLCVFHHTAAVNRSLSSSSAQCPRDRSGTLYTCPSCSSHMWPGLGLTFQVKAVFPNLGLEMEATMLKKFVFA